MTAKATHGGSRPGAGRKRLLSPRQVVWIGAGCDKLARRYAEGVAIRTAYDQARKRGQAAQPGMGDPVQHLRLKQSSLAAIPVLHRKGQHRNLNISELRTEALDWIKAMAKGKVAGFKGHVGAAIHRPKGLRERIKAKMARIATVRYGLTVTPRMVEECWKTYRRRFLKT